MASTDESYFREIPWCADLMHNQKIFLPGCRTPKASTEDQFLAVTLQGNQSIEKWIYLLPPPPPQQEPRDEPKRIDRVRSLVALGSGVNGWSGVCHGGAVATLMDECMGMLLALNIALLPPVEEGTERPKTVTAYLNVSYRKPVPTPSTIVIEVTMTEVQGRKMRFKAELRDENALLAEAESLFVQLRPTS